MRKPSLELKVDSKLDKIYFDKRYQILKYCLSIMFPKGMEFEVELVTSAYEKVENYSVSIFTMRYNGILLFREFKSGSDFRFIDRKYKVFI